MKRARILVCAHKQVELPTSDIYLPIQVGSALVENHWGIQRDDEGDNISLKNRNYSELTAHYWAWKNFYDYDFIGLAHYRRYLDLDTEELINSIMNRYDIILPKAVSLPFSNIHNLNEILTREDVYILMMCLKKKYPEYLPAAIKYLVQSNKNINCNMFITNKNIFYNYSEWLFDILFETEKYVRLSEYSRLKRIFGYFSEVLLPIYVIHNHLKAKYVSMIDFPDTKITIKKKVIREISNFRNNVCFKLMYPHGDQYYPTHSTVTSMKNDNIPLY